MAFDPGLHSAQAAGIPVTRGAYPDGAPGIRMSLEVMAQKIREGRLDPAIIGWAGQTCLAAGLDGRDRSTTPFKQGKALLDALRAQTAYVPDPYGAELIPSAAATLCLRKDLCLSSQDCDGLSVALGAAAMSIGIPVNIVKQAFGPDAQEHVLIAMYDGSEWQYADPSTNMPFGQAIQAESEVWIDPMEAIGPLPDAKPEIVTLGRAPIMAPKVFKHQAAPQHWPVGAGATRIIWPTDVVARKNEINAKVTALTNDIAACTNAPSDLSTNWQAFVTAWKQFYCNNSSGTCTEADYDLFGLGGQYDDCENWDQQVYQWQLTVQKSCTLSEPVVAPPIPTLQQQDYIDKTINAINNTTGKGVATPIWALAALAGIAVAGYVAVKYVGGAKK
jgi:hypothetical protein